MPGNYHLWLSKSVTRGPGCVYSFASSRTLNTWSGLCGDWPSSFDCSGSCYPGGPDDPHSGHGSTAGTVYRKNVSSLLMELWTSKGSAGKWGTRLVELHLHHVVIRNGFVFILKCWLTDSCCFDNVHVFHVCRKFYKGGLIKTVFLTKQQAGNPLSVYSALKPRNKSDNIKPLMLWL